MLIEIDKTMRISIIELFEKSPLASALPMTMSVLMSIRRTYFSTGLKAPFEGGALSCIAVCHLPIASSATLCITDVLSITW